VRKADILTVFMCWFSWNLGASTCCNPQGLSRAVQGLFCLWTYLQSNVLQKLKFPQLLKKFSEFYGNRIFFTVFTTASSFNDITSLHIFQFSSSKSLLISSSHILQGLPACLFPSDLTPKPCKRFPYPSYFLHFSPHLIFFVLTL